MNHVARAAAIAVASGDARVTLYDATSGSHSHSLKGHQDAVLSVAWHPAYDALCRAPCRCVVALCRVQLLRAARHHCLPCTRLSCGSNEHQLCSGSKDGGIRVWDIRKSGDQSCLAALSARGKAQMQSDTGPWLRRGRRCCALVRVTAPLNSSVAALRLQSRIGRESRRTAALSPRCTF